jgi:hypothetical protein
MRTITFGLALALAGGLALAPVAAAGRQNGVIAGSAAAEAKQPYNQYTMRARDVSSNAIPQSTTLDASGQFALNGLAAGTFMVELVKGAAADGSGGTVICQAGPFTLQDAASQISDLMIKKGANVSCHRPQAAYILLAGAAAAGAAAGLAGSTTPPVTAPPPVTAGGQSFSGAQ